MEHQYVDRKTGLSRTEKLFCDRIVNTVYSDIRESASFLFDLLVSGVSSKLLGFVNYDMPLGKRIGNPEIFAAQMGIDLSEVIGGPAAVNTRRRMFERKIRYWERRPIPQEESAVVSPADSRVLLGSFRERAPLFIKEKFFHYEELIGKGRSLWHAAFRNGDFAVFRLTPEKYHYNHTPVAGEVVDVYEIQGAFHACNPGAVVRAVSPYSMNRRVVTVIDTDCPGGTGVGLVAMVEVVALMIGEIVQCYSAERYEEPANVTPGLFLERGRPKSLFRPGSSTTVLIFQENRVRFCRDLVENVGRADVKSRFSSGFGQPLVETDVAVRSKIAAPAAS